MPRSADPSSKPAEAGRGETPRSGTIFHTKDMQGQLKAMALLGAFVRRMGIFGTGPGNPRLNYDPPFDWPTGPLRSASTMDPHPARPIAGFPENHYAKSHASGDWQSGRSQPPSPPLRNFRSKSALIHLLQGGNRGRLSGWIPPGGARGEWDLRRSFRGAHFDLRGSEGPQSGQVSSPSTSLAPSTTKRSNRDSCIRRGTRDVGPRLSRPQGKDLRLQRRPLASRGRYLDHADWPSTSCSFTTRPDASVLGEGFRSARSRRRTVFAHSS